MAAKRPTPTANQQNAKFYADPTMRTAAEAARAGEDWTKVASAPASLPVRSSRQFRAVSAGRPLQPLATRKARAAKRQAKRGTQRLIKAFAVLGLSLLVLVFLIPLVAAVGASVGLGTMVLAYSK